MQRIAIPRVGTMQRLSHPTPSGAAEIVEYRWAVEDFSPVRPLITAQFTVFEWVRKALNAPLFMLGMR